MNEHEAIRSLARIKNLTGDHPTGADILKLAARMRIDVFCVHVK